MQAAQQRQKHDAEIVFMIGEQTGSITFSDVTLYKRANL